MQATSNNQPGKTAGYFSRFQTPFRRRRENKTDYQQRRALITQDKTKYGAKKYRLVARVTNGKVIAQIIASEVDHDITLAQAISTELPRYGVTLGLTNYAAAYCVGLLLARRLLTKLNLAEKYKREIKEVPEDGPRPFKAVLDIGLRRSTTGARVFGVMKGAVDGGLLVPHKDKRFAGYQQPTKKEAKKKVDQAANMRKYIFGQHVADYMRKLQTENPEAYQKQFSRYIKAGIGPDALQGIYEKAHQAIRKDPSPRPKATSHYQLKKPQTPKTPLAERRANLDAKLRAAGLPPRPRPTE